MKDCEKGEGRGRSLGRALKCVVRAHFEREEWHRNPGKKARVGRIRMDFRKRDLDLKEKAK